MFASVRDEFSAEVGKPKVVKPFETTGVVSREACSSGANRQEMPSIERRCSTSSVVREIDSDIFKIDMIGCL